MAALFTSRLLFNALVRLFDRRGIGVVWQGVVCAAIAFCGLSMSRYFGAYLPLDLDLSCYIVLLMWIGYTARQRGLEPSVSKPLLMTLPASWLFASIVRCACDIGLAYVIKKA